MSKFIFSFHKQLLLFALVFIVTSIGYSQTNGDAVINPNNYIAKKIEHFYYDIKGWPNSINTNTIANNLFVDDDMNGIRISIYGDNTRPAHPQAGVVVESYYTEMLNSLARAKTARGNKDFSIFASKKLDGQNSFPAWTKDANGVIVTEYVKLLIDYFLFMKNKGYEIDYLGIQNEEMYNEGNITPAKHKAIVDSVRAFTARLGLKMPLIVGYEDYGPNKNNWMKNLYDNNWMDRMDIYGAHYYPHLRPINNLITDLNYANAANKPFWSTEPHWDNKADVDDWQEAEEAMCALWDQVEVGMTAFMWWAYARSGSLRANLMRATSVPLKDAQMIDMNDIDGKGTRTYGKLQTRAFREGNIITVYAINNHASNSYSNYGFGLSVGTIAGNVTATQWTKTSGSIAGAVTTITPESANKYRMTLPAGSITVFSFNVDMQTSTPNAIERKSLVLHHNTKLQIISNNSTISYQVFNISGNKIADANYTTPIDTSNWLSGIYIVQLSDGTTARIIR